MGQPDAAGGLPSTPPATRLLCRLASTSWFTAFGMLALLLVPAGTWRWDRAWILVGISVGLGTAMGLWLLKHDPPLLHERLKPALQPGQPWSDKIAISLSVALAMLWFALIGGDVFHWKLLPRPPFLISLGGLVLVAASMALMFLTLRENRFLATAVRLQAERGHHLVDTGVYAIVRHPLYASLVPWALGAALWLGSLTAIPALVPPLLALVWRLRIEEAFLQRHLPGYASYTRRVRFRLVPGLW